MSRKCDICNKKPLIGYKVSHANNRTKKKFYPNISYMKVVINNMVKTIKLCTRCRKVNIVKAIKKKKLYQP